MKVVLVSDGGEYTKNNQLKYNINNNNDSNSNNSNTNSNTSNNNTSNNSNHNNILIPDLLSSKMKGVIMEPVAFSIKIYIYMHTSLRTC